MKITAADLRSLGVIDEVVPEVAGGAHLDAPRTFADVGGVLRRHLQELLQLPMRELLARRYQKYRTIGTVHDMQTAALARAVAR